ncbi:MAG: type II toxin-antitoxin system YafQ family toxin [Candidatus Melainabacteria bacterium]
MNEFELKVSETSQFKKDLKKIIKQGKNLNKLKAIVLKLIRGQKLEAKYKDHLLKNNWKSRRECHLEPDWLLIYKLLHDELILERTGSHSELFE